MMISLINVFPWKSVSSSIWVNPVISIGSTVLLIFDVTGIPSIQPGELSVLAGKMFPWESEPSIKLISRVSKPGRRVYSRLKNLPSYFKGYGVTIVSTSKGIMTDKKARISNLSGEILCQVF